MILYGEPVAINLLGKTKRLIEKNNLKPTLCIIANAEDEASKIYVKNKVNACTLCGIECKVINMPKDSNTITYVTLINQLNKDEKITGIIAQLPLPQQVSEDVVKNCISPEKDVDGFCKFSKFQPCTPVGILELIEHYKGPNWLEGKNAVVIGRSDIVGKPMANILLKKNATVTVCHSKTMRIGDHTKNADLIVVAAGSAKLLTREMVKHGAVIIDVGINRINGKLCGDADFDNLKSICDITPVPKGVGPLTVATLINRVALIELNNKKQKKPESKEYEIEK